MTKIRVDFNFANFDVLLTFFLKALEKKQVQVLSEYVTLGGGRREVWSQLESTHLQSLILDFLR